MKKYWKFLLVWLLLLTYFNVNYLCYRGDYLGIPYSTFVAKYWIVENVILIIVGFFYFLLKKSLKVQTLWGRVFNSKLREFFKFKRIVRISATSTLQIQMPPQKRMTFGLVYNDHF